MQGRACQQHNERVPEQRLRNAAIIARTDTTLLQNYVLVSCFLQTNGAKHDKSAQKLIKCCTYLGPLGCGFPYAQKLNRSDRSYS